MESEYLKDVQDWVRWINWHRSQMSNAPLERQVEFLSKANYGAFKLIAGLIDQILIMEEGKKAKSHLLLPVGVKW